MYSLAQGSALFPAPPFSPPYICSYRMGALDEMQTFPLPLNLMVSTPIPLHPSLLYVR